MRWALLAILVSSCGFDTASQALRSALDSCPPHSALETSPTGSVCACDCGWLADDAGLICTPALEDGGVPVWCPGGSGGCDIEIVHGRRETVCMLSSDSGR